MTRRPAAFLDRDGTIIRDANYVGDPDDVQLLPGAAAAIRQLTDAGVVPVIITNQSGIARGYLTADDYELVRRRVDAMLHAEGAAVTATYMCPHHPSITGSCDCRKPGLGLYRQAIAELSLDPARSLFTGDRWRDVAPARELGGLGILLDVGSTPRADLERGLREGFITADSLGEAVATYLHTLPPSAGVE
ncbi:MAG TPA: HAD family hydrolase [Gemmatimonadaceae bacterium]|nr:HAD family hydrolase [Gemmatimonadaceae bacterium]